MKKALAGLFCVAFAFSCVVFLMAGSPWAAAENQPRITVIDNASRVRLANTTHPSVASAQDLGRADPNLRLERMLLILGPADEMQPALHDFIGRLHDKKSANYHQWLTPEQFGERFGPSQADLAKIAKWLQQQGFDGVKVSVGRSHIEFSGSAQIVEHTFQTEMHSYRRGSETHLANNSDITIPRALTGIVRGVNLQNFSFSKPMLTLPTAVQRDLKTGQWTPTKPDSSFYSPILMDPNDFAKIYDLDRVYNSGITGLGETIAIVSRTTAVELTDVETFRQAYHLPPNDPTVILNGPPTLLGGYGPGSGDDLESSLDVEWAGAVAPEATVDQVISGTTETTDGVTLSSTYIVDNNLADIMSLSFGECELGLGPAGNSLYNAIFAQAAAQGISVFTAAGDSGAAACDASYEGQAADGIAVSGLASTPFNTAVGGTEFNEAGNYPQYWTLDGVNLVPNGYIPENVWNESDVYNNLNATGGGVSTIYAKPAWQSTAIQGVPNDNARDLPDVSLSGANHDGYVICVAVLGPCTISTIGDQSLLVTAAGVGGTSASVQVFAGIMALVDQKEGGRQGLANYGLYQLAANETYANCNSSNETDPSVPPPPGCPFNDITVGNNGVPGNDTLGNNPPPGDVTGQLGYNATVGYDPASGLGSVDAFNLVDAWSSLSFAGSTTTLSATTSTSVQHGQPVSFSINVAATSGNLVPTGSVGLIAKTNAPFSTGIGVGGGTLVNGAFTGSVSSLPGGQYNVVAHYAGDGNFSPSDSAPVAVNIGSEASTITITGYIPNSVVPAPSPLTAGYGVAFPIGFNVTSASGFGNPTGTVTLYDGGQAIAQAPVSNQGYATLTNCEAVGFCLGFGTHNLTASYSGDASLNSSTSAQPFVYNVVKSAPTGELQMGCWAVGWCMFNYAYLQSYLPVIPPTGTLTIVNHLERVTTTIDTYTVTQAPITNFFYLPPGNNYISFDYSGDANYLAAISNLYPIFVSAQSGVPSQVTVTALTPIVVGQPVTLQVTVTSSQPGLTPTGYISWLAQDTFLNPNMVSTLVNGSNTIQSIMPNTGPIMAQYYGDSNFAPSYGVLETNQAAGIATPTVALSSNLSTTTPGEQVTLIAAVTPPADTQTPSGTVQFYDSFNGAAPAALGTFQSMNNSSSGYFGNVNVPMTVNLPLGTHVFTASYSGDANYKPVAATASTPVTVSVVATLPSNPASPNFGSVAVGKTSGAQSVNVLFTAAGTLSSINVLTQGAINSSFEFVDAGTCTAGTPFSAGQSCMVDVTFTPYFSGTSMGAVVLTDASGNVLGTQYIVGQGAAAQIAFDSATPVQVESASNGGLNDPEFLATDASGNVFIADNGNQRVVKVLPPGCSATNSCQTVVASSANGLGSADGVALDGAGNLYVSDPVNNQVMMIPPGCVATGCTQVIASQSNGGLSTPRKLAVDGSGDLFIADLNNNRVLEVPAGCTSSACQKALGSDLGAVYGVAVDAAGDVFISDSGNGQVVKLPAGCTGGTCQSTVASGLTVPKGISLDAAGNLYIAESSQVLEVSAATGSQVGLTTGAALGSSANITDVAVGSGGTVFIADPGDVQVSNLDRGDPPSLSFTSTTTPFGATSAPQVVTVEDIGTQTLNLQGIVVTSQVALDPSTTTCTAGGTVAVGASCQLGIEFAPSTLTGLYGVNTLIGNVLVTDNTLNQQEYDVNSYPYIQRVATQTIYVTGIVGNTQTINFPALPNPVAVGVAPITLQATATSGLPVTFTVSGPASLSESTLTILAAGSVTVTANQAGNASFQAATPVAQTITVNATPAGFALTSSVPSLSITTAQSGTDTITVTPSGGFNSQVSFSCSQQTLVTCSFNPTTVTPNSAAVNTTLTVTASSTVAGLRTPASRGRVPLILAFGVAFAGFAIVIVPVGIPRRNGRKRIAGVLVALLVGLIIVSITGCGNSGNTKTPQTGTVTVTASGGSISQSVTLTITVTP
jgi:subtilase family serine protease/sugar lactone lactonase YvrE